jgi:hypothetical protein
VAESGRPSPVIKAEKATISFAVSADKTDRKIRVTYPNWEDAKVLLADQVFEIAWRPQGIEGRIVDRPRAPVKHDEVYGDEVEG